MTSISQGGGTTLYIQQVSSNIQYSSDRSNWTTISSWPAAIVNTNTAAGLLVVQFTTDLTITSNTNSFWCGSDKIQFGIPTLNPNGSRPTITYATSGCDGFFKNGIGGVATYADIYVMNLVIDGTGYSTQTSAGWFGKQLWGYGKSNNYFINCSSKGDIGSGGGGIVGSGAGKGSGGSLVIRGCSSSGVIGANAGGIIGSLAGDTGGTRHNRILLEHG
jgi:hypothetical protein